MLVAPRNAGEIGQAYSETGTVDANQHATAPVTADA